MILVGGGALLSRAVSYARRANLAVDVVCCQRDDPSIARFRKDGLCVLATNNPNADLPPLLKQCSDRTAFSLNNRHILEDRLLNAGISFFNIHSGLVQQYRGIVEVCIFAGLCKGEGRYGVTLHKILPGQRVDSGPVIAQLTFDIRDDDGFSNVMEKSMKACQKIFELNAARILSGCYTEVPVETSEKAYSYNDVARLCADTQLDRLVKASKLGPYAVFFPRLESMIESTLKQLGAT